MARRGERSPENSKHASAGNRLGGAVHGNPHSFYECLLPVTKCYGAAAVIDRCRQVASSQAAGGLALRCKVYNMAPQRPLSITLHVAGWVFMEDNKSGARLCHRKRSERP